FGLAVRPGDRNFAGQWRERIATGDLPQYFPGIRNLHCPVGEGLNGGLRQMGERFGNRRQLHERSNELFAVVLVQLLALLSHGRACELSADKSLDVELLAYEWNAANGTVQQFQG